MNDESPHALEQLIHRELRRLPLRRAPATLLPRVVAAIRAEALKPWWQRPLETWPRWIQVAALTLALGLAAALAGLIGHGIDQFDAAAYQGALAQALDRCEVLWSVASALGSAFVLILSQTPPFVLAAGGLVCLSAYVSCLGLGTILYRLAARPIRL